MEAKSTLRDLVYLGVGAVSLSAHKLEEYANELISKNETVREEGKNKVEVIKGKALTVMEDLNKRKAELNKSVVQKTKIAEKEVEGFFNELIEKPAYARKQIDKINDMAHKISLKTQLTAQEVKIRLEDFIDQLHDAQQTVKMKSDKVINDVIGRTESVKENTLELIDKMDVQTNEIREEMAEKMKYAFDKLRFTLDLASWKELKELDERVKLIEKK